MSTRFFRLSASLVVLACGSTFGAGEVMHLQPTGSPEVVHRFSDREAEAGRAVLTTERAAVFKDGYALIVKRLTGTADERGRVFTEEVPEAAVLGCFWAAAEDGRPVSMHAELVMDDREEQREAFCTSLQELLRANLGAEVTLGLRDAPGSSVTGRLLHLLETPAPPPAPAERPTATEWEVFRGHGHQVNPAVPRWDSVRTPLTPRGGEHVVITEGGQERVIHIGEIRSVTGRALNYRTTHKDHVRAVKKRLTFDLGQQAAGSSVNVRVMYFAPGMRWIPTYRIGLEPGGGRAVLALQAEVLNELDGLAGVPVELVVGVPNFRFRGVVSPVVMERTLRNALMEAAPDIMGRAGSLSNALFSQRASEWHGARADAGGGVAGADLAPELSATGEQDLFVYSLPRLEMKRGDRATLPVLTQSVEVEHLYTLDIDAVRDPYGELAEARYQSRAPWSSAEPIAPPGGEEPALGVGRTGHRVWHQLELRNASEGPWTTGAALVMGAATGGGGGMIPIAQELLRYTPAGGTSLLPVTVAVDLRAESAEEELSRQSDAIIRNGRKYTEVRARTTLTLTNSKAEPVRTRVRLGLGGRAESASEGGTIILSGHRGADWGQNDPGPVNNHSDVAWMVELAPGQTRTLRVEFTYYTR